MDPVQGRARGFTSAPALSISRPTETRALKKADMRAEIENVVDEIKQAISLLRRHL
jgi:hypothetical protein